MQWLNVILSLLFNGGWTLPSTREDSDWVDEIHQMSAQLNVVSTIYHILREANDTADHLARERVYL